MFLAFNQIYPLTIQKILNKLLYFRSFGLETVCLSYINQFLDCWLDFVGKPWKIKWLRRFAVNNFSDQVSTCMSVREVFIWHSCLFEERWYNELENKHDIKPCAYARWYLCSRWADERKHRCFSASIINVAKIAYSYAGEGRTSHPDMK